MRRWWFTLFSLPRICCFCHTPVKSIPFSNMWRRICAHCQEHFVLIDPVSICQVCGRNIREGEEPICFDCGRMDESLRVLNRSVVSYSRYAKQIIQLYKYRGNERIATPLGHWMAEVAFRSYHQLPIRLITFVPMHPERLKQRGFNQAELLAQMIGKRLALPVKALLSRTKLTIPQSKQDRAGRLTALEGAFQLEEQVQPLELQNASILIVDDVYTTGTTLRECAKVLKQAGANQIVAITFAR
jgi:competence protein ComFC